MKNNNSGGSILRNKTYKLKDIKLNKHLICKLSSYIVFVSLFTVCILYLSVIELNSLDTHLRPRHSH